MQAVNTNYESLKNEKNRLSAHLTTYKHLSHTPNYKAVRKQYDDTVQKIKSIFRK